MSNKMIIDASHPEETRVVVLRGNRVEEFDFESASRKPLRGNIYLAKVTRVEPSLQAAFLDYGGHSWKKSPAATTRKTTIAANAAAAAIAASATRSGSAPRTRRSPRTPRSQASRFRQLPPTKAARSRPRRSAST